jgi:DNA-binding transcriptional ArsR family regulator
MMTLRLLETWRSELGLDLDSVLIVLATAAITMEKYTRQDFDPDLRDIRSAMPAELLTRCYVSSIAAATGLNRETARRKVKPLLAAGILLADERGSIRLSPDYTRRVRTNDMLCKHLQTIVHTTNELLKLDVVDVGPSR